MSQIPKLYGAMWVEVQTAENAPPARLQLFAVRNYVRIGRLREDAPLRTAPNSPWRPAGDVIAECLELQPSRAWPFLGIVTALAVLFGILQFVMSGVDAGAGVACTIVTVVAVFAVVLGMPTLRTRPGLALLRVPLLSVPAATGILLPFAWTESRAVTELRAHERIEGALTASDPCAVRRVKEDVESRHEPSLQQRYDQRNEECEEQIRRKHCDEMGAAIDSGRSNDIVSADGETVRLATRIAMHTLTSADLQAERSGLDCPDEVWPRLTKAFARDPKSWAPEPESGPFRMSSEMATALSAGAVQPEVSSMLRSRVEACAQTASAKTKLDDLSDAHLACGQLETLGTAEGPKCKGLAKRYDAIKSREAAVAEAKDARCAKIEALRNECFDTVCLNLDADDPRNEGCNDRCEARYPAPGCDAP